MLRLSLILPALKSTQNRIFYEFQDLMLSFAVRIRRLFHVT